MKDVTDIYEVYVLTHHGTAGAREMVVFFSFPFFTLSYSHSTIQPLGLINILLSQEKAIIVSFPGDNNNEPLRPSKSINILLISKYPSSPGFTNRIIKM